MFGLGKNKQAQSSQNSLGELDVKFHKDCNMLGHHGQLLVSHPGLGINNAAVRFFLPNVVMLPTMTSKLLRDIESAAESQGFIPLGLVAYHNLTMESDMQQSMPADIPQQRLPTTLQHQTAEVSALVRGGLWDQNFTDNTDIPAFLRAGKGDAVMVDLSSGEPAKNSIDKIDDVAALLAQAESRITSMKLPAATERELKSKVNQTVLNGHNTRAPIEKIEADVEGLLRRVAVA